MVAITSIQEGDSGAIKVLHPLEVETHQPPTGSGIGISNYRDARPEENIGSHGDRPLDCAPAVVLGSNQPGSPLLAQAVPLAEDETASSGGAGSVAKLDIVRRAPNTEKVKTAEVTVDLSKVGKEKLPTLRDFTNIILDGDSYPMNAMYLGTQVLLDCRNVEIREGYHLVYQRTAPPPGGSARHYIIAMKVVEQSESKVKIEWYSLSQTYAEAQFPSELATDSKAIYTPYNHGYWIYDKGSSPSITYHLDVDSAGNIPRWLVSDGALLAFPKKLLQVKWDIDV